MAMIKNFLNRIFGKKEAQPQAPRKGKLVNVNRDELGPEADAYLKEVAVETSGLSFFEGHIEHGYSLDFVASEKKCPRCGAATQQQYTEWVYATQIAPRVMMAPAGYFCPSCPTVIVDEAMIRSAINKRFRYQGVLGLDDQQDEIPDLFRTWNGQPAIHIIDEHGIPQGITTAGAAARRRGGSPRRRSTKKTKKQKRRKR